MKPKTNPITNPDFKKYGASPDRFDAEQYRVGLERWLECLKRGLNPVAVFYYGEKEKSKVPTGCFISGT